MVGDFSLFRRNVTSILINQEEASCALKGGSLMLVAAGATTCSAGPPSLVLDAADVIVEAWVWWRGSTRYGKSSVVRVARASVNPLVTNEKVVTDKLKLRIER